MADTFNPSQVIDCLAEFDKDDGTVGSINGPAVWAIDANGTLAQDPDNNLLNRLSATAGVANGSQSVVTCSGNGNLGTGAPSIIVLTGTAIWDNGVTPGATTGKMTFTAEAATPAQAAAHKAAVGRR